MILKSCYQRCEQTYNFFFASRWEHYHHASPFFKDGGPLGECDYRFSLKDYGWGVMCLRWQWWLGDLRISPNGVSTLIKVKSEMTVWFLLEVASRTMLLFGLMWYIISSILNSFSAKNCEFYCCTRLYTLFRSSLAFCTLRIICNRWTLRSVSYLGIIGTDGGRCKC